MSQSEQLAAEFGIDAWPEPKKSYAAILLKEMERELDYFWADEAETIASTREALAALRDTKDVWL